MIGSDDGRITLVNRFRGTRETTPFARDPADLEVSWPAAILSVN